MLPALPDRSVTCHSRGGPPGRRLRVLLYLARRRTTQPAAVAADASGRRTNEAERRPRAALHKPANAEQQNKTASRPRLRYRCQCPAVRTTAGRNTCVEEGQYIDQEDFDSFWKAAKEADDAEEKSKLHTLEKSIKQLELALGKWESNGFAAAANGANLGINGLGIGWDVFKIQPKSLIDFTDKLKLNDGVDWVRGRLSMIPGPVQGLLHDRRSSGRPSWPGVGVDVPVRAGGERNAGTVSVIM